MFRDGELVMEIQVVSDRGFRLPAGGVSCWQLEKSGAGLSFCIIIVVYVDEKDICVMEDLAPAFFSNTAQGRQDFSGRLPFINGTRATMINGIKPCCAIKPDCSYASDKELTGSEIVHPCVFSVDKNHGQRRLRNRRGVSRFELRF